MSYKRRSNYYDIEYDTKSDHEFLYSLVNSDNLTILEMPSGSGRNLLLWKKTNCKVVFVDLEPEMILRLKEKIVINNLTCRFESIVGDMRFFTWKEKFDLVVIPQGGIQLLPTKTDLLISLKNIYNLLSDSGRCVIDINTYSIGPKEDLDIVPKYFNVNLNDGVKQLDFKKNQGGIVMTRYHTQYLDDNYLNVIFEYEISNNDEILDAYTLKQKHLRINFEEMVDYLNEAGFSVDKVFRNYHRDYYNHFGHRMIFILTKKTGGK